jgi:hypothetical protein
MRFEKIIFKNSVKRLAKSQHKLTFKILCFQKSTNCPQFEKQFSTFSNCNFLKTQNFLTVRFLLFC